ncbi:MAG: dTDP-4-dehydrorhamnose 3,5-epimerase [Solirubrobacterales bacterium]
MTGIIAAPMEALPTRLEGPILLAPTVHRDERGFFIESFRASVLADLGIHDEWPQDNHSRSSRGTVRGMHFQPGMAKLVRCVRGEIVDVLVDIRRGSATFGEWEAFTLNDETLHHLYCPDGFAHGFCVASEVADVVYKCSTYYDPEAESGIAYNDQGIGIEWPDVELMPSERDATAPRLSDVEGDLPFVYRA